jgi:hypothetical protein
MGHSLTERLEYGLRQGLDCIVLLKGELPGAERVNWEPPHKTSCLADVDARPITRVSYKSAKIRRLARWPHERVVDLSTVEIHG